MARIRHSPSSEAYSPRMWNSRTMCSLLRARLRLLTASLKLRRLSRAHNRRRAPLRFRVPTPFQLQPTAPGPAKSLTWTGEVPAQKWMNFYTRVLSKFATGGGLRLTVKVEMTPDGGVPSQKVE